MGLPQWIAISLQDLKGNDEEIIIRTLGFECWHPYTTNPKSITIHVSHDGNQFKVWDHISMALQEGTQLFCTAPIAIHIYPFIAIEITETHGGSQTYLNRIYFYQDEIPPSPAAARYNTDQTSKKLHFIARTPMDVHLEVDEEDYTPEINSTSGKGKVKGNSININIKNESLSKTFLEEQKKTELVGFSSPSPPPPIIKKNDDEEDEEDSFDICLLKSMDEDPLRAFLAEDNPFLDTLPLAMESPTPASPTSSPSAQDARGAGAESPTYLASLKRIEDLERTSRKLLEAVNELRIRSPQRTNDEKNNNLQSQVDKGNNVNNDTIEKMNDVVRDVLNRVEQRHAAFIEGFSMASGRSLYSEKVYSDDDSTSDPFPMPTPPNLKEMRAMCGIGDNKYAKAVRRAATPSQCTRQPKRKAKSTSLRYVSEIENSSSNSNTNTLESVAALEAQLDIARRRKALKEAQLKALIDHKQLNHTPDYSAGNNRKNVVAKVKTHWG